MKKVDKIMRQIDELFTEDPSRGTRRICAALGRLGVNIGREKVRRLMDRMGLSAIYCKVNLSKFSPGHKKYPYLLRGVKITRVNQVWSTDITYIRLRKGFVYLTAVILLVQPVCAGVEAFNHAGYGILQGGAGRGHRKVW